LRPEQVPVTSPVVARLRSRIGDALLHLPTIGVLGRDESRGASGHTPPENEETNKVAWIAMREVADGEEAGPAKGPFRPFLLRGSILE
jgi:hypothetical protein